jgi:hypothetical protein
MAHYNECYNFKIHILFAQKNLSLFYCNISSKMYYIKNFTVAIWIFFFTSWYEPQKIACNLMDFK